MKSFQRSGIIALLVILSLASPVFSQSSTAKIKVIEETFIEVRTNLMVLDAGNQYATVKAEDIKVFEDDVEQKIKKLTLKGPDLSLALVVDNTGSMRTQLKKVLTAGSTIVNNLQPADEACLIRFVSQEKISIEQEWTSDKSKMIEGLENMFVEGGQSAVIDAVYLAAEKILERQKSAKDKRFAIVIITDGDDRDSYHEMTDVFKLVDGTGIQIYPFAMTNALKDQPQNLMERDLQKAAKRLVNIMSFITGGHTLLLDKKFTDAQFFANLKSLMIELRSQYVIEYASSTSKGTSSREG